MSRLVVISNRVAAPTDNRTSVGGLAVALREALRENGGIWFGWSGKVGRQTSTKAKITTEGNVTFVTIDLQRKHYNRYYNGFANRVLWPLCHYRLDLTAFTRDDYKAYQEVNTLFSEKLLPLLESDDQIWVHDYHLIPLGEHLREAGIKRPLGFFLHIPFPALEVLTALPRHRDLVKALCAYDVLGFQTHNDLRAFHDYIVYEAKGEILGDNLLRAFGHTFRAEVFPISIDDVEFENYGKQALKSTWYKRLRKHPGNRSWILGVDRLDYSKGIVERFRSFERLLERYPNYRNHITLIQIAPPSRSEVPEYKEIRAELESLSGHINGRFAEYDWLPINYMNRSFSHTQLAAFYRTSCVGLVTPLRDGMNLVAKEYVASQNPDDPGVLVLSRFAGAARELDAALIVNPFDHDNVADAITRGLEMPLDERKERWRAMREVLRENNLAKWRGNFINALQNAPYDT